MPNTDKYARAYRDSWPGRRQMWKKALVGMACVALFGLSLAPSKANAASCCVPNSAPSCDDAMVMLCVCMIDTNCCSVEWDAVCVAEVTDFGCGTCGCQPDCAGKQCGDDGCGGSCGTCGPGLACTDGACIPPCFPSCQGKECGDDHCCGECGACAPGMVCQDPPGSCVSPDACVPSCMGEECGDDGCGGTCGQCPMNWYCQKGMCVPQCSPQCLVPPGYLSYKQCGWDECPGETTCMGTGVCGVCPQGFTCAPGYICVEDTCSCSGIQCGEPKPGCPSCGECPEGLVCDMETAIDPETNICEACVPTCFLDDGVTLKKCGNDGCGGSCGQCQQGFKCDEDPNDGDIFYFQCEPCVPKCINTFGAIKQCGDDGCGSSCGQCQMNMDCLDAPDHPEFVGTEQEGSCESCVAQCMTPPNFFFPMECGPNNCPPGCLDEGTTPCTSPNDCVLDEQCNAETGKCVKCGSCGTCPAGWICDTSKTDDEEIYVCEPCIPNCAGKECGTNGCPPGTCGSCPIGWECVDYLCVKPCEAACLNKECGPDGCGGSCGSCGYEMVCTNGLCVQECTPNCASKECGPDGCGGNCGTCVDGEDCDNQGICVFGGGGEDASGWEDVARWEEVSSETVTGICPRGTSLLYGKCVPVKRGEETCTGDQCDALCSFMICGGLSSHPCGTCPEGFFCDGTGGCRRLYEPPCFPAACGESCDSSSLVFNFAANCEEHGKCAGR